MAANNFTIEHFASFDSKRQCMAMGKGEDFRRQRLRTAEASARGKANAGETIVKGYMSLTLVDTKILGSFTT